MTDVLISAVMIVRDESDDIQACLGSIRDVADEMIVYDTGSEDGTQDRAREAGAVVVQGHWNDDFGRARTDAATHATGRWILVIDADQRLVVDRDALRATLENPHGADAFTVRIDNEGDGRDAGGYAHWENRVVRRDGVRWAGTVHEQPARLDGVELTVRTMPGHVACLTHRGYADPAVMRRKAIRNVRLAQARLDELRHGPLPPDPQIVAPVLIDLGRSLIGADRQQDAVDTFELVRQMAPSGREWGEATDHLARILLAAGQDEVVVVLADQMDRAGVDRRYCDWLRAQALAQLGQAEQALTLVRGIDELVDPAGRRYDLGQVLEVRSLLAAMLGLTDEALATLTRAMVRHGRIRGRGALLLELWGDAPAAGLASIVRQAGSSNLGAVADELRDAGGPGREVAQVLSLF
jgi:hypothetical protein